MADPNDVSYGPPPSNGYADSSPFGPPLSPHPTNPRRNRYNHSSMASWSSEPFRAVNGMSPPPLVSPRVPSSAGSRPLPVPSSHSRGASEIHDVDVTPRPFTMEPVSEPSDDRDWEPEEAMTIGQSEEAYSYREAQEHPQPPEGYAFADNDPYDNPRQVISLDDPNAQLVAEYGEPGPSSRSAGGRFVGGFMATLTRPLKAVAKSSLFDRGATRKGAPGTAHSTGDSHFVPAHAYDESGAHASYAQAVDVPITQKPPTHIPYSQEPSRHMSLARSARRASSHVQSPRSVGSHSIAPDTPRFMTETAMLARPEYASDYAKLDPPPGPPDDSFSAHITRARNFFTELKNLPWVSDRIALDYRPTQSSRARVGKNKDSGSWYTRKHQDLDLLAPGPGSARQATLQLRSDAGHSTAPSTRSRSPSRAHHHALHPHPDRTPLSFMTSPGTLASPGASSHGQGAHQMSYSYYFAPPQPLYVYPSPMTSPLQPVTEGSQASSSPQMHPPHPQALPVYMVPGPPPGLLPATPPPMAQTQRSHMRTTSPTSVVPPTQRSSHSRHSGSNTH
ncbi:hypothetical protein BD311DRAFT_239826 [Dichomitus squalens]|uniref:Uncharacterized protein n=1 Tax=Dichomitus squalens TaxID=114155 RepID=A0A4Q9MS56_9APHY|nr:hypothetical protein BD311DRAFT_239826 [Dichomitus squalens]